MFLSSATILAPYIAIACGVLIIWADSLREGAWHILPDAEDFGAEVI